MQVSIPAEKSVKLPVFGCFSFKSQFTQFKKEETHLGTYTY